MSDEHTPEDELTPELEVATELEEIEDVEEIEEEEEEEGDIENLEAEDEWEEDEEISPEEVESVVRKLDIVIETVESDTVHAILMEAYERIEELVDWEDDNGETVSEAA